jgi:hypothetical protein
MTPSAHQTFTKVVRSSDSRVEAVKRCHLRIILLAGDALDREGLNSWFSVRGSAYTTVLNCYGITETTVYTTCQVVTEEVLDSAPKIGSVIGSPLPFAYVLVLNEYRQLVGPYAPGELWIGGDSVAKGYLDKSSSINYRFTTLPHYHVGTTPFFKSGDCVVFGSTSFIFLGRLDFQVKVRGFRVEPGAIEAAVRKHTAVRDCGVVLTRSKPRTLKAFVELKPNCVVSLEELYAFIRNQLPPQLVPQQIKLLSKLPLTSNKKIDRKRLCEDREAETDINAPNKERVPQHLSRFDTLLELLSADCTVPQPFPKRRYPSGGSLYPVQSYLIAHCESKELCCWYFNPLRRTLQPVKGDMKILRTTRFGELLENEGAVVFTCDPRVVDAVYSGAAELFAFTEFGCIWGLLQEHLQNVSVLMINEETAPAIRAALATPGCIVVGAILLGNEKAGVV